MPVLRVMPLPSDANIHGDVFGGWIMAQVDIAGAIPAARRANGRVATIAVTSFLFKNPVFVGDLLSFYARVIKTGTTSVICEVEVYAERMRLADRGRQGDRSDARLRRHGRGPQAAGPATASGVTTRLSHAISSRSTPPRRAGAHRRRGARSR